MKRHHLMLQYSHILQTGHEVGLSWMSMPHARVQAGARCGCAARTAEDNTLCILIRETGKALAEVSSLTSMMETKGSLSCTPLWTSSDTQGVRKELFEGLKPLCAGSHWICHVSFPSEVNLPLGWLVQASSCSRCACFGLQAPACCDQDVYCTADAAAIHHSPTSDSKATSCNAKVLS